MHRQFTDLNTPSWLWRGPNRRVGARIKTSVGLVATFCPGLQSFTSAGAVFCLCVFCCLKTGEEQKILYIFCCETPVVERQNVAMEEFQGWLAKTKPLKTHVLRKAQHDVYVLLAFLPSSGVLFKYLVNGVDIVQVTWDGELRV